jgi:hypothetical protein
MVHGAARAFSPRVQSPRIPGWHRFGGESTFQQYLSGVDVAVRLVPAVHTPEVGLINPILRRDAPTPCALDRRVPRTDLDECAASKRDFVREHPPGLGPGHAKDRAIQPGLGADVPTRPVNGPAGRTGHVLDAQVSNHDHTVVLGEPGSLLVQPVLSAAGLPGPQASDLLISCSRFHTALAVCPCPASTAA